jgi:alpha-tubulin suppressor-like RCC1 family protein
LLSSLAVAAVSLAATTTAWASTGVLGWGNNGSGRLGNGTTASVLRPTTSLQTEVAKVAAGQNFGMALLKNGEVRAWGANASGQLGNGTTTASSTPVTVKGLKEVTAIAAHGSFALALLSNGTVEAWGANTYGQLGDGTTTDRAEPVAVSGLSEVVGIAAGRTHSLALLGNGSVVAWGNNELGELGVGSATGPEKCTVKEEIEFEVVIEVEKPCSRKPVLISELGEVSAVSAGGGFSSALLSNGTVKAWGANGVGQLGDGTEGPEACETTEEGEKLEEPCSRTPVSVSELGEVSAISAGGSYDLALLSNGTVKAWGANGSGQLGDGTNTTRFAPVAVSGLEGVSAISAGSSHSLALLAGGALKAWGSGASGALGTGETANTNVPVAVVDNSSVESVASGFAGFSLSSGPIGPVATAVKPGNGRSSGGTSVSITGTHLLGTSSVEFGTGPATSVTVVSETEVIATTPASTKLGAVTVTVVSSHGVSIGGPKFSYVSEGVAEIGRCQKLAGSGTKYKTATCTEVLGSGKFEWLPGVTKPGFTGSGGVSTFESTAKAKLTCAGESASGEYAEPKQVTNLVVRFTGCESSSFPGSKCSTSGASEGEIVTTALEGSFGRESTENEKVGLDLFPTEGGLLFSASCAANSIQMRGSVIGLVTPINKMSSTFTIKFKASKGKQAPEHLAGESNDVLEMSIGGGSFLQTGLTHETTLTNAEEVEINTVV